ncbi:MAG TPA: lytic transglycosylase domain-containing protein [Blastocatellia bacterium]|nr:lytic transglycosylase domain-containing protein [Blastocatellia bacterium]
MINKLVSTIIATAVMGAATLFFTSHNEKSLLQSALPAADQEAATEATPEKAPRGLTRQRLDFEKAISVLAQGAENNPQLAEYYSRVQKRIQGEAAKHENISGIRAVKVSRKINPPSGQNSQVAGAAPDRQEQTPEDLKGFAEGAMVAESQAAPKADQVAEVETLSAAATANVSQADYAGSSRLTIGDMAYSTNPAIDRWVNWYTATPGGRRTMTIGIQRSNAYLKMARAEFRRAGLPEDLVWLAHVESVWNPNAVSPAAAGGLWQFIPKTAIEYGLAVESGNDERSNPMKQTRVAAEYLHDLYTIFGDWALAMAAYNSGEPRVMEAIVKNGRANFWELYEKQLLPKETRDYVPKILAAIKVADLADSYGVMPGAQPEEASIGR